MFSILVSGINPWGLDECRGVNHDDMLGVFAVVADDCLLEVEGAIFASQS